MDSGTHRRYCTRGYAIPGHATNYVAKAPKLGGSRTASWNLPGLADVANDVPIQMSLGFQLRNNPRLHSFRGGGGDVHDAGGGFENFINGISKMLRKIGDAFAPQEYDTLNLKRKGSMKVPRGHAVSEREWAELKADRKVTFNPRIGATLIPTKGESYPTPAHTAACFFSNQDMVEESKLISSGESAAEWAALLAETRKEATEAREKAVQARLRAQLQQQKAEHLESRGFLGALGAFFA
eukprot:g2405.t1